MEQMDKQDKIIRKLKKQLKIYMRKLEETGSECHLTYDVIFVIISVFLSCAKSLSEVYFWCLQTPLWISLVQKME